MNPVSKFLSVALLAVATIAAPSVADASARKEGTWPEQEKKVSFDFEGKPSEGLEKLAHEADWSLVVSKGITIGEHDVRIHVEDQPADAVLDALFMESNVVLRRNGTLITVTADSAASAPAPSTPPAAATASATPSAPPPIPAERGNDRNVFGESLTIQEGEVVHTVTVTGGSVKVSGTVTGDLVVTGGSAHLRKGARVVGNVTVFGGSIHLEDGSRIDGDVGIVGGSVHRADGAVIGGKVMDRSSDDRGGKIKVHVKDGNVSTEVSPEPSSGSRVRDAVRDFGRSTTKMSLLFVFGCVLLALATGRMEKLRVEAAARPMRSFALGIVGSLCAVIMFAVVCITIIGIPFAALAFLLFVLSIYGAIAAVLTTFGAAVIGHKTTSPYAHLLFGCAVYLVLSAIPYVGGIVTFVLGMVAVGILVATRAGGTFVSRKGSTAMV